MKHRIFIALIIAVAWLFASCSKDEEPTAPSSVEMQAAQNKQILAEIPETLLKEFPENELTEVRAGRLFIWFVEALGAPPDPQGRCAPLLTVNVTGSGVATHLGRFTDEQSHCLNPATLEFTEGFATFTSIRTGDQLFIPYWGVLAPTPDPTLFKILGNTTFSGGTGRFEGATGQGIARGILNVATGETQLVGISTLHLN